MTSRSYMPIGLSAKLFRLRDAHTALPIRGGKFVPVVIVALPELR